MKSPKKRKYVPDPGIDSLIRGAYGQQRWGDRTALMRVAAELGWPPYSVARRGAELGLCRTKEKPWSAEEEAILLDCGQLPGTGVQRRLREAGYQRTCAAIALKLTRMHVRGNSDGYSAHSLATAFGVDVHKVLSWINVGYSKPRVVEQIPFYARAAIAGGLPIRLSASSSSALPTRSICGVSRNSGSSI